jgi:Fur family ferric uptake transcriptional regulator
MKGKLTNHQQKVLAVIAEAKQNISAQDIYQYLRQQHRIGLATVYRALETLKLMGKVSALTMPSGETLYSLTPSDQHHLNCLSCAKTFPLDLCPIDSLQTSISQKQGFRVFYHTLEFFGLCHQCQQKEISHPLAP